MVKGDSGDLEPTNWEDALMAVGTKVEEGGREERGERVGGK